MNRERAKIWIGGAVQGVGFRPFIFRLATNWELCGWVLNSANGVLIEAEGSRETLSHFLRAIEVEKPPAAIIENLECTFQESVGYKNFEIRESRSCAEKSVSISPDLAICEDCLREILDPKNRRYRYSFTNCTNCGPRFSIIEALPYDRTNTSMKQFAMCAECKLEYHDPANRRFHAQPNACPNCGPQLEFWNEHGNILAHRDDALHETAGKIRAGKIIALKGLGGFQLLVDARNDEAVRRLRQRKCRDEKPFALMFPDLEAIHQTCGITKLERKLLESSAAPIVLLKVKPKNQIASSVAPENPNLGAMLPYTPLHHLLMSELGFPIIATSGNASDEPICINEFEAVNRLRDIADFFLVHNRPIVRHVDDSIVRVVCDRELMLRRARGFAPLPIQISKNGNALERFPTVLGVGAHLKNSVALNVGNKIFISQHIGDLQTKQAWLAFHKSAVDMPHLYEVEPELVAHDLHPDYLSTQFASEMPQPHHAVQHHWAHVVSCMAENKIEPPALGVSWDGTGYGTDGAIWGGEFFLANKAKEFQRVASFRSFPLPGGEAAIKQPCRIALGLLHEIGGEEFLRTSNCASLKCFSENELNLVKKMLVGKTNSPMTSSVGRLFDAIASILDLRQRVSFEGQAAMAMEFSIQFSVDEYYDFKIGDGTPRILDWEPMICEILKDISHDKPVGIIAAKFHNTLAEMIVAVAKILAEPKVILSGGSFQNKYLIERTVRRLRDEGLSPYWHRWIPPNDGGIALGQILATLWKVKILKLRGGIKMGANVIEQSAQFNFS